MKTRIAQLKAIGIICAFFILVLGISFVFNPHYPVLVIVGESSVGTWMSGTLLIIAASLSIVMGIQKGWFPWIIFVAFFLLLALDERFMFHEQIKEGIIFNTNNSVAWRCVYDLPVLFGAFVGLIITLLLWRNLCSLGKILLIFAMLLGSISVLFDILSTGAFIEDGCKLLAELCLACALVGEVVLMNEKGNSTTLVIRNN
jgi:hypothetical protein